MKTEPETFSFEQLLKDKKTGWDGVRNFQARNFLKEMKVGDLSLIYHSGKTKEVVGIAKITKEAYPDPDPKKKGDWVKVDIIPVKSVNKRVTLSEMKSNSKLDGLKLLTHSRLSVMPVQPRHFELLLKLSETKI